MKIGIQGDFGSTNERAAKSFALQQGWTNYQILPLHTTANVLAALKDKKIDYGTFAWESSRAGLVAETQAAIQNYQYKKISELVLNLDHVLLANAAINLTQKVNVFSHPQAIKEHKSFLQNEFSLVEFIPDQDTGYCAKQLAGGMYPTNSLVIAPVACAKLYNLTIYRDSLPGNIGYWTRFYLVASIL